MPSYNSPVPYFMFAINQVAEKTSVLKKTTSVELADGIIKEFTLPATANDFDFNNVLAQATVNGDTFDAVDTLDGRGDYEKIFTVALVSGVVTFTFKYPPMQVVNATVGATPNGFKEALVANTNAPATLTPVPLNVSYNATI